MKSARATRACSTRCWPTPTICAASISANDQRKLDEYLDSVRDVEQRIENAGQARANCKAGGRRSSKPNIPRPADGIPQDIAEHMRLMCDILVLGFQTDTTRITHAEAEQRPLARCASRNLGVDYMIHHLLSHCDTADWLKVNQFFLEQVAYIARKLDAIQEGPRTLLDNTMLLFCSSMLTGNHDATQVAGRDARRRGRTPQGRPRPRLQGQTRAPDVPALSLDDGQDERAPAEIRRRHETARGSLTPRLSR